MSFLAVVSTPIFPRRLSSVLSKFSHKKIILFGCYPDDGVTRGGPPHPLSPSDATGENKSRQSMTRQQLNIDIIKQEITLTKCNLIVWNSLPDHLWDPAVDSQ